MSALILAATLIAFVAVTAFVFCSVAKRLIESRSWTPWWIRPIAYAWLIVGLPADYLFNKTFGCLIFREGWRESLFTARVQFHVDESTGKRHDKALKWAEFLNAVDPGHIKL